MSRTIAFALLALLAATPTANAGDRFITVASTTSTQNAGLYDYLLPRFTAASGIDVRVVAVGTGQALKLARRGDVDVLLVHHQPSEESFVKDGFGRERFDLMFNDFIVVGPPHDPANLSNASDVVDALRRIAASRTPFISRGDDSGTHKRELSIWQAAGLDPVAISGTWYLEAGAGMGATLNIAVERQAYTLSDRGTWLSFKRAGELRVLSEGDPRLLNQYGVILVDPARFQHIKADDGQAFIDWLLSPAGQQAIGDYTIGGKQLFVPNASS